MFDALEACAAFEAVDCRFKDLAATMAKSPYDFYADHIAAGAMVFGAFRKDWQKFDFTETKVSLQAGLAHHHREDRRPSDRQSGDPRRACSANLRRSTTGLQAGMMIVTGSFTGFHPVALNVPVRGEFEGFGTMEATIVG